MIYSRTIDEMFDGVNRRDAGPVTVRWEVIQNVKHGEVARPTLVTGRVVPRGTDTRSSNVPDPLSGFPMEGEVLLHKGHLMALSLGGPDVSENIVPQYAGFQSSGVWRRMERACETDARKLRNGRYLFFSCSVWYYSGRDPRWASERLLKIPKGFIVYTQVVDAHDQPFGARQMRFSANQEPDKTDRRLVVAAEVRYDQARNPADTTMAYSDIRMVKGKVKYGTKGEDALYEGKASEPLVAQFGDLDPMSPLVNELFTQARALEALPKKRQTMDSKGDEPPPLNRAKSTNDTNSNATTRLPGVPGSQATSTPVDMLD